MSKGIIIHLDNDSGLLKTSTKLFQQKTEISADFEYITCTTEEEFKKAIELNNRMLKCLIFDLVGHDAGKKELQEGDAEFLKYVDESFAAYNTPIFIYSGYLDVITEKFKNCGTVFKVDKDEEHALNKIFSKIKLFHESGFLDVFCPGGDLEEQIRLDLNKAFAEQFKSGEIESIIESFTGGDQSHRKERCSEIFKRISVRALMSKLLSPVVANASEVNAIEHYYRQISEVEFWTGDIIKKKEAEEYKIILTPRCDCREASNFLACSIELEFPGDNKKDKIKKALTDNINDKKFRYLPPTPIFKGGKVDYSLYSTISRDDLHSVYDVWITLSDELTNAVLAKFGSYFLRTGISTTDIPALEAYLDSLNETSTN